MKKISVLFVCLGNICRSPAAEAIFISLLEKKGLTDSFIVDSAGTGSWHIGKKADSRMRIAAERRDINILSRARQINSKDFDEFNYILAMDDSNFRNIQDLKNSKDSQEIELNTLKELIKKRDFEDSNRDISPLIKANDAIEIITDGYSINEVVDKIIDLYNDKIPKETQIQ